KVPTFAASAFRGTGVVETLKAVTLTVFKHVRDGGLAGINGSPAPVPKAVPTPSPGQSPKPAMVANIGVPAGLGGALPRPPTTSGPGAFVPPRTASQTSPSPAL